MSKKIIDLSQDSDDEIEYYNSKSLSDLQPVPSPLRWSPVFTDDQHSPEHQNDCVTSELDVAFSTIHTKRKVDESDGETVQFKIKIPKNISSFTKLDPSPIKKKAPDPSPKKAIAPVFNPNPNRFYCHCFKTQVNHTHEKYLAARGLSGEERTIYWSCPLRARQFNKPCSSTDPLVGCNFFTRLAKPDVNEY